MAKKISRNGKLTTAIVITFVILLISLIFRKGSGVPMTGRLVSLPNSLYTYVILPLLYYLGGFVFMLVFFKNSSYSVPSVIRTLLTVFTCIVLIFIIFFIFMYLQEYTIIGGIVRISVSKWVMEKMYVLMSFKTLIFTGGIFLYNVFS